MTTETDDQKVVTPPPVVTPPKMVPETDLLAVKGQVETAKAQVTELEAKIVGLTGQVAEHQTAAARLQAEVNTLNPLKDSVATAEAKVAEERTKAEAASESLKELNSQLLDLQKERLTRVHNIPAERLEGKTLAELQSISSTLELVSPGGQGDGRRNFDGGGPGGNTAPKGGYNKIRSGLDSGDLANR